MRHRADDEMAQPEVDAPRVTDLDLERRFLALSLEGEEISVGRTAVDSGAGAGSDLIIHRWFERMLRDHRGGVWWILGLSAHKLVDFGP